MRVRREGNNMILVGAWSKPLRLTVPLIDGFRINEHGYRVVIQSNPWHIHFGFEELEHVVIAEKALGHYLPVGCHIHHSNRNKLDNTGSNLVICPNQAYHALLHRRMRARDECGNPNWIQCFRCRNYDDPANMKKVDGKDRYKHANCKWSRGRKIDK